MDELTEKQRRIIELQNETVLAYRCGPGDPYSWILPLAALLSFLLLAWLIAKGRLANSNSTVLIWAITFVPCFVGVLAILDGLARYFRVIEQSGVEPEPTVVYVAIAFAFDWLSYGMKLAIPGFVLMTVASLWRRSPT